MTLMSITSGQSNLTEDRIAATDGWFNRIRQVAPMSSPMCAHWCHLVNTTEPVLPLAHPNPQLKRQIDRGLVIPKFSVPPSGKTMHQTPKGTKTCSRSSITMPSLMALGFHPPPGRPKTLSFLSVCLSVCLSVTLLNVRDCAPDFASSTETILMLFDREGL